MATSKFFTWTKGEPAKSKRKPIPLDFYHSNDSRSSESFRAGDSIALQDAAVQSATSLLAVMNDCLNSHLLSTQQQSAALQPVMYGGRPRSKTAPSTPMCEVPERTASPVELPGSFPPLVKKRSHAVHQSMDSNSLRNIMSLPHNSSSIGHTIERPHSSPQESHYTLPVYPRNDGLSHATQYSQPPPSATPRSKTTDPCLESSIKAKMPFKTSDDTLVATHIEPSWIASARQSIAKVPASARPDRVCLHTQQSQQDNKTDKRQSPHPRKESVRDSGLVVAPLFANPTRQWSYTNAPSEDEVDLLAQIASIRSAHDAHLTSLKEAHEREIASHRAYISLLEKRKPMAPPSRHDSRRLLTIDTHNITVKGGGLQNSDASATTSLQSFESSLENQKRASSEAVAEAEALKRKLSLSRKAQAELGDVRRERDQLREGAERNDRRISQLKDIVRKAKDNEKAYKESEKSLQNAISGLEAALVSANNERIDVLEGFHEVCEQLKKANRKESSLLEEREDLRSRLSQVRPVRHSTSGPCPTYDMRPATSLIPGQNALVSQLDVLKQAITERDSQIRDLERRLHSHAASTNASLVKNSAPESDFTMQLKVELDDYKQQLATAQADRDRYNALLHSEIRKQTRSAVQQKLHAPTPQIESEASQAFARRMRAISMPPDAMNGPTGTQSTTTEALERELRYCIQEIMLYKLDIKGYKKDLKKTRSDLEALQDAGPPPKPANEKPIQNQQHTATVEEPSAPSSDGLGISWTQPPKTPTKTVATATASALLSASSSTPFVPSILSPPHRPTTPLGKHKKLPKPPASTGSPSPRMRATSPPAPTQVSQVHRQETLRSLSESIISSYAKRGTPEQNTESTLPPPPPRGRSSDPATTIRQADAMEGQNAIAVSLSRYTPQILGAS